MDGSPKGFHVAGLLGSEKSVFPIVANGPKPTRNQNSVNPISTIFFCARIIKNNDNELA